jgi:hypothetical protein
VNDKSFIIFINRPKEDDEVTFNGQPSMEVEDRDQSPPTSAGFVPTLEAPLASELASPLLTSPRSSQLVSPMLKSAAGFSPTKLAPAGTIIPFFNFPVASKFIPQVALQIFGPLRSCGSREHFFEPKSFLQLVMSRDRTDAGDFGNKRKSERHLHVEVPEKKRKKDKITENRNKPKEEPNVSKMVNNSVKTSLKEMLTQETKNVSAMIAQVSNYKTFFVTVEVR